MSDVIWDVNNASGKHVESHRLPAAWLTRHGPSEHWPAGCYVVSPTKPNDLPCGLGEMTFAISVSQTREA